MSKIKNIPSELQAVLDNSSGAWTLAAFKTWQMGWTATINVRRGNRVFHLVSDRGYIDAYDATSGKDEHLFPPKDQRTSITPAQVAALINAAISSV